MRKMVNNQGLSAIDYARLCNRLEIVSLFLPNNPEEEIISLDSVIKSVGRYQNEPDMFNPPSFMLTPEQGNKSSVDLELDMFKKPSPPSFTTSEKSVDLYQREPYPF